MINLYKLVVSVLIASLIMLFLGPAMFQNAPKSISSQWNNTANYTNSSLSNYVFKPIHTIAVGTPGAGLNSNVTVFTGVAFVMNGFGSLIKTMLNLPTIFAYMISTTLTVIGIPVISTNVVAGIAGAFIDFILIILGISIYMKFNVKES
jgi:hypothetical protein